MQLSIKIKWYMVVSKVGKAVSTDFYLLNRVATSVKEIQA